ncbi:MAG: wax ester/triacylglycerol synthase family O-acyltransferase [Steroidobacteraceae bacterium]|nr:wax ester/triacylglycerol synthase family O-acyltransferase [Steroidobacteraceae bacterium]
MKTHPLNPLDAAWTQVESRDTPMHVAALCPFTLPEDAPPDYLRNLMSELRSSREFYPPWSYCLRPPGLTHPLPVWVEQEEIDLEYHVRHLALPRPGGERELGQLIARLHSQPIDMSRPPWEFHLIEGLEGNRFAIYLKMHHSLIDGISGVRLVTRCMSEDREQSRTLPPFWSPGLGKTVPRSARSEGPPLSLDGVLAGVKDVVGAQLRSAPTLAKAFASMLVPPEDAPGELRLPFAAPRSILNGRVRGQRRVATQQFEISRLRAVAKAAGCTLNDVVLALCGGTLRRFLLDEDELPRESLTAGVPVSFRPADDEGSGNAITFAIATLGTDIEDPLQRLAAVVASTKAAKAHLSSLPRSAITQYTVLLMAPSIVSMLTPIGGRTRPMFNVTVSNVPGPPKPLYFRGARMEAVYPISLIAHGIGLNITCESYAGALGFAFVGCRDTLPHLQNMARYAAEAFAELEAACAPAPARAPAPAVKKAPARRKKSAQRRAAAATPRTAARRRPRSP